MMSGRCELIVVPGATHLFEGPGTLQQVSVLARDWFLDHSSRVAVVQNEKTRGADIRAPTRLAPRNVLPGPWAFVRHMDKF